MKPFMLNSHYKNNVSTLFYSLVRPMEVKQEEPVLFNEDLALELGMNPEDLKKNPGYFSGRTLPPGSVPIAQAYSGHQFGFYTRLGDGRAILLGEWEDTRGKLWDLQLKGAGRTPYSRGGDGKAALAPMLREYLISEAMAALGVPTTRSLALVLTGVPVYREVKLHGAMLTRIAKSHLRIGTFQYALEAGGEKALKELAGYAISRHFPELTKEEKPYLSFLKKVIEKQAKLIALWMSKGFIHGVMNTDNMSIAGETIDYGPCAFMDYYDPETVFSSIDTRGRYAYGNQPTIAQWNLTRFAESLLPLLTKETEIRAIEEELIQFIRLYKDFYDEEFRAKLGLKNKKDEDSSLIGDLLDFMLENTRDFTNTFIDLSQEDFSDPVYEKEEFLQWKKRWKERSKEESSSKEEQLKLMKKHNSLLIPRNHLVENVLEEAKNGDIAPFLEYLELFKRPYDGLELPEKFKEPMSLDETKSYRTFCGT